MSRSANSGSLRKWATMINVSSRTLSVALIQLLAPFGDNSLQFVGFLARERTGGAVDDGVTFLIGDGYNHFEIFETLGNPYGVLGRAVLEQMKLKRA